MNKLLVTTILLFNYCFAQETTITGQNDVSVGEQRNVSYKLSNVIFRNEGDMIIDYRDMVLTMDAPEIGIDNLNATNLMFDLYSDIGTISIDGILIVELQYLDRKLSIKFNNVKVRGPVSLQKHANAALTPLNADLVYSISDIVILADNKTLTFDVPTDILWFGIENNITKILLEQAPERINKLLRKGKANEIVDNFLHMAKSLDNRTTLDGTQEEFRFHLTSNIKAVTNVGVIKNIDKIQRYQNFTMIEKENTTLIYGYLTFPQSYEYQYSNYTLYVPNRYETNNVATITASSNKVLLEMTFDHLNNCAGSFNARFVEIDDIKIKYSLGDPQAAYINALFDRWMLAQLRLRRTIVEDWITKTFDEVYWNELYDLPLC